MTLLKVNGINRSVLKTNVIKYTFCILSVVAIVACSTKRNSFLSRNSHALSTKYNILYNGELAIDQGVKDLKGQFADNFWEILPIERMQVSPDKAMPGEETRNPNFQRSETKAAKAIQKHSMNIGGVEKNPQIDEAYLMLGKSRYYDQRFVPALEAFNYILYKYPKSDKIYEAKIWREKTNMRLENDQVAVNNLRNLLKEIKFKDQIFADANAALAQAFLNLEEQDSAVAKIRLARDFTKSNEEKARYNFILAQLFEKVGEKDSAFAAYQTVIDMNRKAARQYVIQAHARQAAQFDYKKGDTLAFVEKYKDLLEDRENRPYLDVINHQLGIFYGNQKNYKRAKEYYNLSLKKRGGDQYLAASNYRNIADINFDQGQYLLAGKYYDSTLVQLDLRSREHRLIEKKRENLVDVIKYEAIAAKNDSILNVIKMSPDIRIAYYEKHIEDLKVADAAKLALAEKMGGADKNDLAQSQGRSLEGKRVGPVKDAGIMANGKPVPGASGASTFYFYNPSTVAFGQLEFKKNWGNRTYKENWRLAAARNYDKSGNLIENEDLKNDAKNDLASTSETYSVDYYLNKLPTGQKEIDSIGKERNFAYYQLGVIYKEKFKEYNLAASKLETLLTNVPEDRLVLPTLYNLYKIYEIIDPSKALVMKNEIITQFPDSRYAQILSNPNNVDISALSPENAYDVVYKKFKEEKFKEVLEDATASIDRYTGDEITPKFELLKASATGRIKGLEEYKKSLNFVALNYPNSKEGKIAEAFLRRDMLILEHLQYYAETPTSWKIIYKAQDSTDKNTKALTDKIKKFIAARGLTKLTVSNDQFTMTDNFVVIHNLKDEEYAKGIASILKEFKDYKIKDQAYVISNDNYKILQIRKDFDEYLNAPKNPTKLPPLNLAPEDVQPDRKQQEIEDRKALDSKKLEKQQQIRQQQSRQEVNSPENEMMPPGDVTMPPRDNSPKGNPNVRPNVSPNVPNNQAPPKGK